MAGQIIQKLQFLGRRVHYLAVHLQLIARQVHRELIIADDAVRLGLGGRAAAQHGFDARHHFLGVERLYYIVVRTQLQAEHLVEGLAFSREHDNGCVVRRADAAAHLPAVHFGHHHVQQHHVGLFLFKRGHGGLAIVGDHRLIALFGQVQAQQLTDIFVVVRDQNFLVRHGSHSFIPLYRARFCAACRMRCTADALRGAEKQQFDNIIRYNCV